VFSKNKLFLLGVLLSAQIAFALSASAQVLYQPRINIGIQNYELSVESNSENVIGSRILASETFGDSNTEGGSISDTILVAGVGVSALYKSYFVDFYVQESFGGDYSDADSFTIGDDVQLPDDLVNSTVISGGDLDRQDIAFSVGRAFDSGFALSAGYKLGVSQFSQSAIFGSVPFNTDYEFETNGPFVGLSYGFGLAGGTFGLNVAIAELSAEYKFANSFFERPVDPIEDLTGSIDGDATGVTVGLSWRAPFPYGDIDGLSYAISLDTYDYEIDLEGQSVRLDPTQANTFSTRTSADLSSTFNESASNLKLSLQYLF